MGAVKANAERSSSGYLERTHRPLNCLIFILPLLAAYEAGAMFYRDRLLAPQHLAALLELFGATARFLPALLVVGVLLIWHGLSRQRWRVDGDALLGMTAESVLGMVPLIGLGVLMQRLFGPVALAAGPAPEPALAAEVLSGIGAGIYEEFLFRLAAIGVILFVCVDVLRAPKRAMSLVAVFAASVIFSVYHFAGPGSFNWHRFVFRLIAGLYLALLYVGRGFGIAVGAHACYNVVVLAM
jgi:membrane protease YdiL (CAAX protease family)